MNKVQAYDPHIKRLRRGRDLAKMVKAKKGKWVSRRAYNKLLGEYNEALRFQVIS